MTLDAPRKTHYILAQQYTVAASVNTPVRPYRAQGPLQQGVAITLHHEQLPEPLHYRVELAVRMETRGADETLHQSAEVRLEGIAIVAEGLTEAQLEDTLKISVGGALLGAARVQLSALTTGTGYQTLVLPPVPGEQLRALKPPVAG